MIFLTFSWANQGPLSVDVLDVATEVTVYWFMTDYFIIVYLFSIFFLRKLSEAKSFNFFLMMLWLKKLNRFAQIS